MASYNGESETESERHDSPDDDDGAHSDRPNAPPPAAPPLTPPLAPPPPPAPPPVTSTHVATPRLPTPWNNIIALSIALAAPRAATLRLPPPSASSLVDSDAFVSPFALLAPPRAAQRQTCTRCCGDAFADDPPARLLDDDETPLAFCCCCRRCLPRRLLRGDDAHALRCAPCLHAGDAAPGLQDALIAELPSHVRLAGHLDAALATIEAFIRELNAQRKTKLDVHQDTRIVEINKLKSSLEDAEAANKAKQRAAYLRPKSTKPADAIAIYDEWVALEKQRVIVELQRLVALDHILGEHFLQSPASVATFLTSMGLLPADPFPMLQEYDTSEQCGVCEVLLSRPAPVADAGSVVVGFCDCCKRVLPQQEVHRVRPRLTISFCLSCQRRRDFSLISDADLQGIPDVKWCERLARAARRLRQGMHHVTVPVGKTVLGRMTEAYQDLTRCVNEVDGLSLRLEAVVRSGDTSMEASRHWYATHSTACRGLVAAALQLLLVATGAKPSGQDRQVWKSVIELVHTPDRCPEHALPEWLTSFINERWPKQHSPKKQEPSVLTSKSPAKAARPPQHVMKPPQPMTGAVARTLASSNATSTPQAPVSTSAASPKKPKSTSTISSPLLTKSMLLAKANALRLATSVEYTCERCGQQRQIVHPRAKVAAACCYCCEIVIPESMIQDPPLHPRVSLCAACYRVQSSKSPEDIQSLAKRTGEVRLQELWVGTSALKQHIGEPTTLDTPGGVAPDARHLSAVQEVDRWRRQRKSLPKRQRCAFGVMELRTNVLRALYAEEIKTDAALRDSLFELVQVGSEIVSRCGTKVSMQYRETITKALKEHGITSESTASANEGAMTKTKESRVSGSNIAVDKTNQRPRSPEWTTPQRQKNTFEHHRAPERRPGPRGRSMSRSRSPGRYHRDRYDERPRLSIPHSSDRRSYEGHYVDEHGPSRRRDYNKDDRRYRSRSRSRERRQAYRDLEKRARQY